VQPGSGEVGMVANGGLVPSGSLCPGRGASTDLVTDARTRLSSDKLPRELRLVEQVPRTPSGKPNYPAAKELFA
jgi:acyl-CoA synthetase (AMP-forming)/AMP-acid ligase II